MKKILMFSAGLILAGLVLAFLSKDWLLKAALEQAATRLTGFKTKVEKLHFDFPSTILVQGLEVRNPQGFKNEVFASVPEIYIALDLPELLRGERIHLREMRLNLQEVDIEKNEQGISNVSLLSSVGGQPQKKAKPAEPQKAMPFYLERLELTIRRVHYEDRSGIIPKGILPKGGIPTGILGKGVKEVVPSEIAQKKVSMDLNIEKQIFTDIRDPATLVNLILVKILYGKTFGNLKELGVDPDKLLNTLNLQNTAKEVLGTGGAFVQQTTGLVTENVGSAVGEVGTKAGQLTGGTRNQVTGLFGKLKNVTTGGDEESAGG